MNTRLYRLSGALIVFSLALVACGATATASPVASEAPPAQSSEPTSMPTEVESDPMDPTGLPSSTEEPAQEVETVTLGDSAFGSILVDSAGLTLYLFTTDEPGKTNCYDGCAQRWPPLLVDMDPVVGSGVEAGLLATTDRTDGTVQVTYNGWPLYYFASDRAPGDTKGQGVGEVWYVVSAAGEAVLEEVSADDLPDY